jgi:hypothetical protein
MTCKSGQEAPLGTGIRKFVLQVVGMHGGSPWGVEMQLLVPRSIAAVPGGSLGRAVSQSYQTSQTCSKSITI